MKQKMMRVLVRIVTVLMWASIVLSALVVVVAILLVVVPSLAGNASVELPAVFASRDTMGVIDGPTGESGVRITHLMYSFHPAGVAPGLMAVMAGVIVPRRARASCVADTVIKVGYYRKTVGNCQCHPRRRAGRTSEMPK